MVWVNNIGRCVIIVGRQQCYLFYRLYLSYIILVNMKVLVDAFKKEKALVIVKYSRRFVWSSSTDGTCHRTRWTCAPQKVSCFQQPPAAAASTKPWKHRKWVRLNSSGLCSGPAAAAFISSIEWNCTITPPPFSPPPHCQQRPCYANFSQPELYWRDWSRYYKHICCSPFFAQK